MTEAPPPVSPPDANGVGRVGWGVISGWLVLSLAVGGLGGAIRAREALRNERTAAARDTRRVADALAVTLNGRMGLVRGLQAFVELIWDHRDFPKHFDQYSRQLIAGTTGVRAAQYVIRDTIKQIYPLEGNEAALGLDLNKHPDSSETIKDLRAAQQSNKVVLSGPLQLVQGGKGLIGRVAARDSAGELLTVVALVLDLPPLLSEAGLTDSGPMLRALRDDRGRAVGGADSIFQAVHVETPVTLVDRTWVLASMPSAGWLVNSRWVVWQARLAGFIATMLLGWLLWLALSRQEALRRVKEVLARKLAEERFARLSQISPDGVVLTRVSDGTILEVNDAFLELSGFQRSELIGRSTLELGMWLSEADRNRLLDKVRAEGACVGEAVRVRRKDGVELDVEFSARFYPGGEEPLLLSLTRDVTERRRMERQLAQAQRMEAIGRLAGGVAHDFNNILTAIVASAETARMALPADHPAVEESAEILRASVRASDLTRQLLAFARRSVVTPTRVDVSEVGFESVRMLQRIIGEDIRLVASLAPGLPPVLIDPTQLQQVLLNLAVNARDAMPNGGTLSITTQADAGGVAIEVRDTGIGIRSDDQPFIFEPFFTTKEAGKGTGLGLATVYGIVQQAGGRIAVESSPGMGAKFMVWLPVNEGAGPRPVAPPAASGALRSAQPGERVLLAEDDPQVRNITRKMLVALGYQVLTAVDGADALRIAGGEDQPIDLLVTDVVMPHLSGVDLARALGQRWNGLKVLYLSGYPEDYSALARALESGAVLLPKPYTPADLAAAVRRAMDSSVGSDYST